MLLPFSASISVTQPPRKSPRQYFDRKNVSAEDFIKRPDIAQAMGKNPHKTHHIFIVLATPVAKLGRDHDYDWAMVEPSSMRSNYSAYRTRVATPYGACGRHAKHRDWQYNIRALKNQIHRKIASILPLPSLDLKTNTIHWQPMI